MITWIGSRPPTPAEQHAIAQGYRSGVIRDGDEVGPGLARRVGNPSTAPHASTAYESFHWGNPPDQTQRVQLPSYSQGLYALGKLRAVEYETTKGDEHAIWVHQFRRPYPTLTATPSGKLGPIVGGGAFVTDRGIEK